MGSYPRARRPSCRPPRPSATGCRARRYVGRSSLTLSTSAWAGRGWPAWTCPACTSRACRADLPPSTGPTSRTPWCTSSTRTAPPSGARAWRAHTCKSRRVLRPPPGDGMPSGATTPTRTTYPTTLAPRMAPRPTRTSRGPSWASWWTVGSSRRRSRSGPRRCPWMFPARTSRAPGSRRGAPSSARARCSAAPSSPARSSPTPPSPRRPASGAASESSRWWTQT
mmetsp:Transcript_22246/g.74844  ORF Transcript_22246/g.74844 Transcript_22246/m.74844 type:complete len:224 (+) Transcript_22246:294-965(+)